MKLLVFFCLDRHIFLNFPKLRKCYLLDGNFNFIHFFQMDELTASIDDLEEQIVEAGNAFREAFERAAESADKIRRSTEKSESNKDSEIHFYNPD